MPNITGKIRVDPVTQEPMDMPNNAFYQIDGMYINAESAGETDYNSFFVRFDASRSNPIYGNSDTVQPPAYVVYYIMRVS